MLSLDREQYLWYVLQIYCDKKYFLNKYFEEKNHLWIVMRDWEDSFSLLAHLIDPNNRIAGGLGKCWVRSRRTRLHQPPLQIRPAPDPSRFYLLRKLAPNPPVSAAATPQRRRHGARGMPRALPPFLSRRTPWTNLLPWAWFSPAGDYDLHRQLGVDAERRLRAVAVPGAGWCGQPHLRRQDSGTNRPPRPAGPSRPVLGSDRSDFRSFLWVRVSGILDLIPSLCWVGAVEPGEHGRRHDDGRQGRPRACHSHQWPREDPRLYAR